MPQSLAQIYIHLVFSTKQRRPYLQNQTIRSELHKYLGGICRNQNSPSVEIGGVADHVHILFHLGRTIALSDLVREVKRDSSKWVKQKAPDLADFDWQDGYGAFSISPSHVEPLRAYIRDQEGHPRKESFQDEFRRLLEKYEVEYDERYVWD